MAASIHEKLAAFEPTNTIKYDPGKIIVLLDDRLVKSNADQFSSFQSYWTEGLYRLGWPSVRTPDLDPGNVRLVWYTHIGNEGFRDFPLYRANLVKEMFDSLSEEGFRPMLLGWSAENPYPMIGGSEPPLEPVKPKLKVATTVSGYVSGHRDDGSTPHDRVMAIITEEERREAGSRKEEVYKDEKIDSAV